MFHVGQHVVCIRQPPKKAIDKVRRRTGAVVLPEVGKVYTIRHIFTNRIGELLFYLCEIHHPLNDRGHEPGFLYKMFRPLAKLRVEDFIKQTEPV